MRSEPTTLWQWFTSQNSDNVAGVAILTVLAVTGTIVVLAGIIYYMHKNRLQHELKRELLDRGFNAEEIATIIYGKARLDSNVTKLAGPQQKAQVGQ